MTLPFVGASVSSTSYDHFGYIFGAKAYEWRSGLEYYTQSEYVPGSLKTVVITGGTRIGSNAFYDCSSLTSITIPDSVTSIGVSAFYKCYMTGVYITDLAKWCSISFESSDANPLYYADRLYLNGTLITDLMIPDSVTHIGSYAFYSCGSLTSITIGNGVTSIGAEAFSYCSSLNQIMVSEGNTVYHSAGNCLIETGKKVLIAGCKSSIIPTDGSVTSIGGAAFSGRSGLTSITIPDSVTSIGKGAFSGCSSLTSMTIPFVGANVNATSPYNHFGYIFLRPSHQWDTNGELYTTQAKYVPSSLKTVVITGGVSIGSSAFSSCSSLTSITIPDSVTSIGDSAFYGCSSLTSITIPDSVTSIGSYAFSYCSSLIQKENGVCYVDKWVIDCDTSVTKISLRNNTVGIGARAFSGRSSLTSITIPNSVTSIGNSAFSGCSSLMGVYITDIAKWCGISFGSSEANPLYYAHQLYLNGTLITNLDIPEGVTSIGDSVFYNCSSLTSITIPDSVTSISKSAFEGCSRLIQKESGVWYVDKWVIDCDESSLYITLRNNTIGIGDDAFFDCSSLWGVTIPNSVTRIGSGAFGNCRSMGSITIPDSVTSIGRSAFSGCSSLTIFAEAETKPSGWNSDWNPGNCLVNWGYDGNDRTYPFETNGGSTIDSVTAKYLTELPTPEKEGFVFCGWYDNSDFTGDALTTPYCSKSKTVL